MAPTFKKSQGPKSIFKTVTDILRGDAILKGLVDYTPKDPNIRRGFQPIGKWVKLITYFMQPEIITDVNDFSPNIRSIPLVVGLYTRDNEIDLMDMEERVIQLLDSANGARLSRPGFVHVYDSQFVGELTSIAYDDELKAFFKQLRFVLTVRKEG